EWVNNTMCLDTGAVFGGKLTALRYPEREVVSVKAHRVWYEPSRPLDASRPLGGREPAVLELADVTGKRIVQTAHHGRVGVSAEQSAAARCTRGPDGRSSRRSRTLRSWRTYVRRRPGCSSSWSRAGCCSTRSCCRGAPRLAH